MIFFSWKVLPAKNIVLGLAVFLTSQWIWLEVGTLVYLTHYFLFWAYSCSCLINIDWMIGKRKHLDSGVGLWDLGQTTQFSESVL